MFDDLPEMYDLFIQENAEGKVNLLNNPGDNGFYYGLSGTSTNPIYSLGEIVIERVIGQNGTIEVHMDLNDRLRDELRGLRKRYKHKTFYIYLIGRYNLTFFNCSLFKDYFIANIDRSKPPNQAIASIIKT